MKQTNNPWGVPDHTAPYGPETLLLLPSSEFVALILYTLISFHTLIASMGIYHLHHILLSLFYLKKKKERKNP